jgi:hypothetical protein
MMWLSPRRPHLTIPGSRQRLRAWQNMDQGIVMVVAAAEGTLVDRTNQRPSEPLVYRVAMAGSCAALPHRVLPAWAFSSP